jgi:hypothetical protein
MTDYFVRVTQTPEGIHQAVVRQAAAGIPCDVIVDPRQPVGHGEAATIPAAVLAALLDARLGEVERPARRAPYAC